MQSVTVRVHAGEEKRKFVDPIHQILESVGGVKGKRQRVLKVFMDQHSLQIGDKKKPWDVMQFEAQHCRIGRRTHHPATLATQLWHVLWGAGW
jgi:hypothetical protein